ncbi:unnamed protein product [Adineta steineri]|uniref:Transposase n=1 Tax=Adineta steineri TaxID=433720 RepID=A0A819SLX7_9BILA|nr:unnamed protein product [Adineta steineri]
MCNSSLTKDTIIQLIKNDDVFVTFVKPKKTSSSVWVNFSCIYVNNMKQNFVSCDTCKDILHYTSTDGTSCMRKQQKSCQTLNKNNQNAAFGIKEYFRPKTCQKIPTKLKDKITNATVEFVSLDTRAFELVCGDGFLYFAQTLLDVGKKLSNAQNINVVDLLPHPTTVSRNINKLYTNRKTQLIDLCKSMKSYSVVVDFWTDAHTGVSFCGIALFHLTEDLQLLVFTLGCYPYDQDNQTSPQVRQFVDSKLMEYHLSLDDSKFVVCDNENKMKSSFKVCCTRIGCSIHYLSKQVQHCFTTDTIDKVPVNCDIIQQMFRCIRRIVSHMRRAHKQSKLPRKLQSYSDTRFNGAFHTMDVFLLVFDDLAGVLDRTLMNDYMLIDKDLLVSVCSFLKPFEEVMVQLSCDTKPTIHKVLPLRQYLLQQCIINSDDQDGIQQMKKFIGNNL